MIFKVIKAILSRILKLFLLFFGTFRRLLCCFRKRKESDDSQALPFRINETSLQMESVPQTSDANISDLQSWQNWDDNSSSNNPNLQNVNPNYATSKGTQNFNQQQETEVEPNYFESMIPEIRRPKKIIFKNQTDQPGNNSNSGSNSRLSFDMKAPYVQTQSMDLTSWDENIDSNTTWEENMDIDVNLGTDEVLKEKRRVERQKRNANLQKKKNERDKAKKINFIATKVS